MCRRSAQAGAFTWSLLIWSRLVGELGLAFLLGFTKSSRHWVNWRPPQLVILLAMLNSIKKWA